MKLKHLDSGFRFPGFQWWLHYLQIILPAASHWLSSFFRVQGMGYLILCWQSKHQTSSLSPMWFYSSLLQPEAYLYNIQENSYTTLLQEDWTSPKDAGQAGQLCSTTLSGTALSYRYKHHPAWNNQSSYVTSLPHVFLFVFLLIPCQMIHNSLKAQTLPTLPPSSQFMI